MTPGDFRKEATNSTRKGQERPPAPVPHARHGHKVPTLDDFTRAAIIAELDEKLQRHPIKTRPAHHASTQQSPPPKPEPIPFGIKPPPIPALMSLRFPLAIMIMLAHAAGLFGVSGQPWQFAQAVTFFFVLSGFVLAYNYPVLPKEHVWRFYVTRAARIWPLYLIAIALMLITDPAISRGASTSSYISNLFLVHYWAQFTGPWRSINYNLHAATWTLSTLLALYLLFPLLVHRFEKTWWWKLPAALASAFLIIWCSEHTFMAQSFYSFGAYNINKWVYSHFLVRIFDFTLGMTACMLCLKLKARWQPSRTVATIMESTALLLAVLSVLIFTALTGHLLVKLPWVSIQGIIWIVEGSVSGIFFAGLVLSLGLERGWISRILSHPFPVLLGQVSFACYLLHPLVTKYYRWHAKGFPDLPRWIMFPFLVLLTTLASFIVWRLVEQPIRRYVRSLLTAPPGDAKSAKRVLVFQRPIPGLYVDRLRAAFSELAGYRGLIVGAQAIALGLLLWGFVAMAHARPNIAVATSNVMRGVEPFDVEFGPLNEDPQFVLRGVSMRKEPKGLKVRLVWESLQDRPLDYMVQVHMIKLPEDKPAFHHSRPQDASHGVIRKGTVWEQTLHIPRFKLDGMQFMAIGLNKTGIMLMADRGLRDWQNRRLLIPLHDNQVEEMVMQDDTAEKPTESDETVKDEH